MVALTIAGLSACGMNSAEETRAYHGHGVSSAYPARWQEQRVPSSAQDGKLVWSVVFADSARLTLTTRSAQVGTPIFGSAPAMAGSPESPYRGSGARWRHGGGDQPS